MGLDPCPECGGKIKPVNDLFKKSPEYLEFKKQMEGMGIPESKYFNCTKCGQIYDEDLNKVDRKLGWLNK